MVELLLDLGADPNQKATKSGDTPLHKVRLSFLTLSLFSPSPSSPSHSAKPLFQAVLAGDMKLVDLLVKREADVNIKVPPLSLFSCYILH
jgi:ankyrin repeat protein